MNDAASTRAGGIDSLDAVLVEQRERWRAGERVSAEEYAGRFPALFSDPDALLDLIYNEVLAREELGEAAGEAEYAGRFPALADRFRRLFEVHAAVPSGPAEGGAGTGHHSAAPTVSPGAAGGTQAQSPEDAARAAARSRSADAAPGYEILGELGKGGMGVVYRARDLVLGRVVALKMILGGWSAGPGARVRFRREAEAVARLQHPNVVQIYAFGESGGYPYLALEFAEGGSLADKLRGTPLPPAEAARLTETLARAVQAAHDRGIVHRDLKPANILLAADGTPKIADFGLAKRVDAADGTTTGVFGTPAYMAPEQARGESGLTGPATDVYGLGAILYELLTGRPPFRADSPLETLRQVVADDVVPARRFQPRVPRELETICQKCLEKEPRRRYASAAALADDLGRFLAGKPIRARPISRAERFEKWVRRNPGRTAGLTAAVLLAVGVAVAAAVVRSRQAAEARAGEAVMALATADTPRVPRMLDGLAEHRARVLPRLRAMAAQPVKDKPGLHARMALVADEPARAGELADYLPDCRPDELIPLRDVLTPHAAAVTPTLWALVSDGKAPAGRRVRAAAALAGFAPEDARWRAGTGTTVVELFVNEDPLTADVLGRALEPVGPALIAPLTERYDKARARIQSRTLDVSALAGESAAFDAAARLLTLYVADRPDDLVAFAVNADDRHHALIHAALAAKKEAVAPRLRAQLSAPPEPDLDAQDRRKGNAAAALFLLGETGPAWEMFKASSEPGARSYLIARLSGVKADPLALIGLFDPGKDVSACRAILLALGDFEPRDVRDAEREKLVGRLLDLYESHRDPGLHSAIDWLLRRRWGRAADVENIDAKLRAAAPTRAASLRWQLELPDPRGPSAVGPSIRPERIGRGRDWYVNSLGLTFAVVRAEGFVFGSPPAERRSIDVVAMHRRIGRTFAISTKEVSVPQFKARFPGWAGNNEYNPDPDGPAVRVPWYVAAQYCNWLSWSEGIPEPEWCYEPNPERKYAQGMRLKRGHLALSGYRLPTEAEWEFACRAGTTTRRHFGRGDALLGRYARYANDPDVQRAWSVGGLRPNDLGLFDTLGNAQEFVEDPNLSAVPEDDTEDAERLEVLEAGSERRIARGGSILHPRADIYSAFRVDYRPSDFDVATGFRVARTLP